MDVCLFGLVGWDCDRLFCSGGGWFVLIGLICWCGLDCSCRSGSCCLMVVSGVGVGLSSFKMDEWVWIDLGCF